jgi:hypothetical protein
MARAFDLLANLPEISRPSAEARTLRKNERAYDHAVDLPASRTLR